MRSTSLKQQAACGPVRLMCRVLAASPPRRATIALGTLDPTARILASRQHVSEIRRLVGQPQGRNGSPRMPSALHG